MAIHIKASHRGLFTARAKREGHSMGQQISSDLHKGGNKAKQANFARMARRHFRPLSEGGGEKRGLSHSYRSAKQGR